MIYGLDIGRRKDRSGYVGLDIERHLIGDIWRMRHAPLLVQARALRQHFHDADLIVADATGLGLGLAEALGEAGLPVIFAFITSGEKIVKKSENEYTIGKTALISLVMQMMGSIFRVDDLEVNPIEAAELRRQLSMMVTKPTARGYKLEAAEGHDDLVLALALALFGAYLKQSERRANERGRS